LAQPDLRSAMGNSPSADLGGGSTHSSRDVRTANPEMEVKRSIASRAPTHNEYTELPASSKPHNNNSLGLQRYYNRVSLTLSIPVPYRPYAMNVLKMHHGDHSPGTTDVRFYRAVHYSAKRGIAIACRLSVCLSVRSSVCLSVTLVDHDHLPRIEILETKCTDN